MSKPPDAIPPGTHRTIHGIDVVAVSMGDPKRENDCHIGAAQCPFFAKKECEGAECSGVIWLTVADYITHRLTR